ncbi:MAG TPA: hypothetical protein VGX68_24000 [Thermoanaerobaculia bacterium]|jgi:hypothetical protein|nr:hypothetical protein [Thermoanaerobaculia bacterium]
MTLPDDMAKLSKTSVQLSPEILEWLDGWPAMTRSEAIRLALERTQYLHSQMSDIEELAETYKPILAPALEEFWCENFRTVIRALPQIVGSYIRENYSSGWKDERTGRELDYSGLHKKLEAMHPAERMYLLDCVVARRMRQGRPL